MKAKKSQNCQSNPEARTKQESKQFGIGTKTDIWINGT